MWIIYLKERQREKQKFLQTFILVLLVKRLYKESKMFK